MKKLLCYLNLHSYDVSYDIQSYSFKRKCSRCGKEQVAEDKTGFGGILEWIDAPTKN